MYIYMCVCVHKYIYIYMSVCVCGQNMEYISSFVTNHLRMYNFDVQVTVHRDKFL